jgi:hypothetical protein
MSLWLHFASSIARLVSAFLEAHVRRAHKPIAALKSLGMIPRSPSPSPTPKPELIKQEKPHEPVPNTVAVNMSSATIPRPRTASVTPVPLRQRSSLPPQRYQPKLTKKNMLILLKHYRGSSEGLKGHPEKELTILLSHYRVSPL